MRRTEKSIINCTKCEKKVEHPLTTTQSYNMHTKKIEMILCDKCDKEFIEGSKSSLKKKLNRKAPYWLSTLSAFLVMLTFGLMGFIMFLESMKHSAFSFKGMLLGVSWLIFASISALFLNVAVRIAIKGIKKGWNTKPEDKDEK